MSAEPGGYAADALYVLAMYPLAGGTTVAELRAAIIAEGVMLAGEPSHGQVSGALANTLAKRRPALVERVGRGRWRVSAAGLRALAAWCGEDDDVRVPCGLGWPAEGGFHRGPVDAHDCDSRDCIPPAA
jgi:hypothetical protein